MHGRQASCAEDVQGVDPRNISSHSILSVEEALPLISMSHVEHGTHLDAESDGRACLYCGCFCFIRCYVSSKHSLSGDRQCFRKVTDCLLSRLGWPRHRPPKYIGLTVLSVLLTASLACTCFLLALALSTMVHRVFFHRLRHFPGPLGAKFSRFWNVRLIKRSDFKYHVELEKLRRTYGDFVLTGFSS